MGAELCVMNDRLHDLEILRANIFTPGQGIHLQSLAPGNSRTFKFDHSLAYGSWYDIQIIARTGNEPPEDQRFLRKGIYLSIGKKLKISELTDEDHCDHGVEWNCGNCNRHNIGSVAICKHCNTNRAQAYMDMLSMIPIIGIPFGITDAVLRCGKAGQSNRTVDKLDASITALFAVIDIITAPFFIGAFAKITAKVAGEYGVKLTAEIIFTEVGGPLLKELAEELGKDGIMGTVQLLKANIRTAVEANIITIAEAHT